MAKYNPRKIHGSWSYGYVLDLHSTGSTFIGDNEFGHPQFEMHRTEIGDLLFRLKYRSDETAVSELLEGAFDVISSRIEGHRVLLVDDLYRSGATMNAIADALLRSGATAVFAFAFTQTRRRA